MKYVPFWLWAMIFSTAEAINEITKNEQQSNGGFSLIGKRIVPTDNSYAKCLDSGCSARIANKEFICMSEPYTADVQSPWDKNATFKYDMIKVFSLRSGRMYEVLFSETDLVDD